MAVPNWATLRIKDVGRVVTGRTPPTAISDYFGEEYPFITPTDMTDMNRSWKITATSRSLSKKGAELLASIQVPPRSVCVSCIGWQMGKVALTTEDSFTNQQINTVIPNGKAIPEFIYYTLSTRREELKALGSVGTRTPILNKGRFEELEIRVPDKQVQEQVVGVLAPIDELISVDRQRIDLLEELGQSAYRRWFLEQRYPGAAGEAKDESERSLPSDWTISSILDVSAFRFIKENVQRYEGEKRYFATADIDGIDVIGPGETYAYGDKPARAQKQPTVGSVWFARMRDTFKVLCFTQANRAAAKDSMLSSGFVGFETEPDWLPFLYFTVRSPEFHRQKDQYCTGATQVALTNEGLARIKVRIPDDGTAAAFAKITAGLIDQRITLQRRVEVLESTRDLLLRKLMSDDIPERLDEVVPFVETGV